MKKLLLILLSFFALTSYGQAEYEKLAITANTASATAAKVNVQETNGEVNFVTGNNIPIPYIPLNYSVLTPTTGGHYAGIDAKLGALSGTTAGISTRVWLTADQTTITAGTFDLTNPLSKGTAASHQQTVANDDNQKKYFTTDLIGLPFATATMFPAGTYAGNLTASTTPTNANQKFTVELYKCNNAGTPIASGVSGAPIGSLGVTVIMILDSGEVTLANASVTNVSVAAVLGAGGFSIAVGERIRYHVSAEKVGTAGGVINESVYYGSSYNSFIDVPVIYNSSSIKDVSTVTNGSGTVTDALNNLYASIPVNYSKIVYVNNIDPNSATIFDLNNPPVTNDNLLKSDVANLYVGTDASGWVYNSTSLTYVSKSVTGVLSNNAIPKSSAVGLINSSISDTGTGAGGIVNINNFVTSSFSRVLVSGPTSIGKILNLTGTNATSQLLDRSVYNYNEDTFISPNIIANEVRLVLNKTTNTPGTMISSLVRFQQNNSATIGSIIPVQSDLSGTGTGTLTNAVLFKGTTVASNTFPITNFTGLELLNNPQNNVPNAWGVRVGNLFGTTISRAFDSAVSSGIGKYNIYSGGTAANYFAGNVLIGTTTPNGNAFRLTGTAELITSPTTSAGTFDILSRNTSTGVVEKVLNSDFAHLSGTETFTGTKSFRANSPLGTIFDVDNTVGNKGINMQQRAGGNTTGIYNINYSTGYSMDLWKDVGGGASGDNVKIRSNVTGASNLILDYNSVTGGNTNLDIRNNGATTATISNLGNIVANSYSGGATLTGTPTAPTATIGTNTTQIATTAFVQANSTSGSYTPTLTAIANCSSLVLETANYIKVGNIVSVKIFITGAVTSASTLTEISLPLPVNKSVAANKKVGTFNIYSNSSVGGSVGYVITNQTTATLSGFNGASAGSNFYFIADFQYDITQ